jgi:hypothetical protein
LRYKLQLLKHHQKLEPRALNPLQRQNPQQHPSNQTLFVVVVSV